MKALLLFFLLAAPAFAQDTASTSPGLAACGSDNVKFAVKEDKAQQSVTQMEPGKALVYVIEDYAAVCLGGCATVRVGLDGAWIGANRARTYFFFAITPGEHHLCSNWQSNVETYSSLYSLANFTAEAGRTYYFRTRVWFSYQSPRLDLEALNSDEGNYLVASSRLAVSHAKK
jgi:Protein of unknown function (DUF2846)